MMIVPETRRAH